MVIVASYNCVIPCWTNSLESTATNDGTAMITIYFKQGVNADMAAVNVQNRVSQAQVIEIGRASCRERV